MPKQGAATLLVTLFLVAALMLPNVACFLPNPNLGSYSRHAPAAVSKLLLSSSSSSSSSSTSKQKTPTQLSDEQLDFFLGYLNKYESDVLLAIAESFSELGKIKSKKNAWSGGSFSLEEAKIVGLTLQDLTVDVTVQERNKEKEVQSVTVALDAMPSIASLRSVHAKMPPIESLYLEGLHPVDRVVRLLMRLCWMVDKPKTTGRLIQLGIQLGGSGIGKLKENMYLNQVPHNRYVRQYFYDMCAQAVMEAVVLCSEHKISNRMKVVCMFPEMNPSMDSYRIGTVLELVRSMAIRLYEQNLRVRVSVQGSMGVGIFTGVPKQLNGVSKLLQMMDWQSEEGEENEGMVGTFLNFGSVGKDHVVNAHTKEDGTKVEQGDVFIVIAPQSMVGVDTSIIGPLSEMVEAAGDRPVILINPDLTDKVSSQGQQNVRGRQDRINFANSFETVYQFQNIYVSGTSYFPILGSMTKLGPLAPWVAHQRRDLMDNQGEIYVPVLAGEEKPSGEEILASFES